MASVSGGTTEGGREAVRRLRRRADHRAVAGVAGGLADYTGIPVWLIRLAFIVLAFTGGGILLYAIGWVLIPAEDESESIAERALHGAVDGPAWVGGLLLLIGAALIASRTRLVAPALVWGLSLIVLGVYVFRRSERGGTNDRTQPPWTSAPPPGGEAGVTPAPAAGDRAPASSVTTEVPAAPAAWTPPAARVPRERSGLGWFVLGLTLAVAGLLATLDQAGALSLRPGQYLGLIMAILGGGMLVGAWIGRARWLAIPALLLLPIVAAASLIHVPFRGGFGERVFVPATSTELRSEYRLIAGHLTLDLSGLDTGASTLTVRASVVAGRLDVILPPDVPVTVSGTISAGAADLFGRHRDGSSVPLALVDTGTSGTGGIQLEVGISYGYVHIVRATSSLASLGEESTQ